MFKLFLLPILLIPAWSADVTTPNPPDCLTKPVTLGSVTLSCILMETDPVNGATDPSVPQFIGYPAFQVKLSSTDPDVVAFRVGVTYVLVNAGVPVAYTLWGTVGKSPSPFIPQPASPTPYYRYTFMLAGNNISASNISGIQVQELKASTSQTF